MRERIRALRWKLLAPVQVVTSDVASFQLLVVWDCGSTSLSAKSVAPRAIAVELYVVKIFVNCIHQWPSSLTGWQVWWAQYFLLRCSNRAEIPLENSAARSIDWSNQEELPSGHNIRYSLQASINCPGRPLHLVLGSWKLCWRIC
jgi:hypothetical protein